MVSYFRVLKKKQNNPLAVVRIISIAGFLAMLLLIGLNDMYYPRGSNTYGAPSGYAQYLGMTYSGSSVGGHDGVSQHSLASRHSSILGGPQDPLSFPHKGCNRTGAVSSF